MKYLEKEEDFNEFINKEKCLVDFYANWCEKCKRISPLLEKVSSEGNLELLKIDVDKFPALANKYAIMAIPTIKLFSKSKELKSHTGYLTKDEIKDFVK